MVGWMDKNIDGWIKNIDGWFDGQKKIYEKNRWMVGWMLNKYIKTYNYGWLEG